MDEREALTLRHIFRPDFNRIVPVLNKYGTWDILLRLDGGYAGDEPPISMLQHWHERVGEAQEIAQRELPR